MRIRQVKIILWKFSLLLVCPILMQNAQAVSIKCFREAILEKRDGLEHPFWKQTEPVLVRTADGTSLPLTFSFDSEIPSSEIYSYIYKNPELFKKLQRVLDKERIPLGDVAKDLQMSRKQLLRFAIRKEKLPVENDYIVPTDLYPRYASIFSRRRLFSIGEAGLRKEAMSQWLGDLPIAVDLDSRDVEIKHTSFETSPAAFKKLVTELHNRVNNPQTHFHLGFPAAAMSSDQLLSLTRAMETRTVLQMAVEDPNPTQKLIYHSTYLNEEFEYGRRGVIKGEPVAFPGKVPAHDFELRQWSTLDQAFDELRTALNLAQNSDRLRNLPSQNFPSYHDEYTQNLKGALLHAGILLSSSHDSRMKSIGEKLSDFSSAINSQIGPTEKDRKAISKFLSEHRVLELLDSEAFLKPAGLSGP
jgi:hypothetical protein